MNSIYKHNEALGTEFMQIPIALFANKKYKNMSLEAKVAYSLLFRRMQLSNKNGWINTKGEIFVIFTREQMSETLRISRQKAIKAFQELKTFELIFEKKQGRGLANLIYVAKVEVSEEDSAEYSVNLRSAETESLEVPNRNPSKKDSSYNLVCVKKDISILQKSNNRVSLSVPEVRI